MNEILGQISPFTWGLTVFVIVSAIVVFFIVRHEKKQKQH